MVGVAIIAASISPIKLAVVGHGTRVRFLGHAVARRFHRIGNRNQLDFFERRRNPRVDPAQMPRANNGHT